MLRLHLLLTLQQILCTTFNLHKIQHRLAIKGLIKHAFVSPHNPTNSQISQALLTAYSRYRVGEEKFAANLALSMPLKILPVPDVAERARSATSLQRGESARRRMMRVIWGKMSTQVTNLLLAMGEERALGQVARLVVTRPGCRILADR